MGKRTPRHEEGKRRLAELVGVEYEIDDFCSEFGITRRTYFRWVSSMNLKAELKKSRANKIYPHKSIPSIHSLIDTIVRQNPSLSARGISENLSRTHMIEYSYSSVQRYLNAQEGCTKDQRLKKRRDMSSENIRKAGVPNSGVVRKRNISAEQKEKIRKRQIRDIRAILEINRSLRVYKPYAELKSMLIDQLVLFLKRSREEVERLDIDGWLLEVHEFTSGDFDSRNDYLRQKLIRQHWDDILLQVEPHSYLMLNQLIIKPDLYDLALKNNLIDLKKNLYSETAQILERITREFRSKESSILSVEEKFLIKFFNSLILNQLYDHSDFEDVSDSVDRSSFGDDARAVLMKALLSFESREVKDARSDPS